MNQVFKYIRNFYNNGFSFFYLLVVMAMLGILIYLNYWQGLEKEYVSAGKTMQARFAGYYLLYFIPFAAAFFLQRLFFKDGAYYKNRWFWAVLLLAPAIFSFRVNFNFLDPWINKEFAGPNRAFYFYSINWITKVLVILILVFICWFVKDRNTQPFYGIKPVDTIRPYLVMLVAMVPLIALASTQPDFLKTYPKAKLLNNIPVNSLTDWWRYIAFELSYGFDFLSIELFFRGFLVLALVQICGQHCIIPAACFYCTIHFGKPMGEAVSSFFGGILLGIVSFNTLSIRGGLLAHLGIAWLMEIGGFAGQYFGWSK